MTDNDISSHADDEISLVDLFAVLLAHRRLIIVSTLVALALAVLAYFVYPAYSLAKAERERIVEVNARLMLDAGVKSSVGEVEGNNFILQSLNDPATILAALRESGYEKLGGISLGSADGQDSALYAVRRRLIENKSATGASLKETSRMYVVALEKGVVSIIFKNGEPDRARVFVEALLNKAEDELQQFVLPYVEDVVDAYERLLETANPSEAIEASIAQGYHDYIAAKKMVEGTSSPLVILRKPYLLIPEFSIDEFRADTLKKGVLLVFGVFFMAVFGAFVLQYIESVKKDPAAMAKIRDAMGRPRS